MMLDKQQVKNYQKSRSSTFQPVICHAPFSNLNFEQNGQARACCYNKDFVLGVWPQQSIQEIWEGVNARQLRQWIWSNELGGGCSVCGDMINAGNHQGVRARYFDDAAPQRPHTWWNYGKYALFGNVRPPRMMEFELSNQCNLECVMCNGYFSSAIRKNREHLPPLQSPYDDRFVSELIPFLPHLKDAKFLGGEPFMIDIYLDIWEQIRVHNPNMRIHITTNGTFYSSRVQQLLEGLNAGIVLSIDSLQRDTYELIRKNASFDRVMKHFHSLREYTLRKKTFFSLAVCPIQLNWQEIPEILMFCLKEEIFLHLNVVFSPAHLTMEQMPKEELQEAIRCWEAKLSGLNLSSLHPTAEMSLRAYKDFILQMKAWLLKKQELPDLQASKSRKISIQCGRPWDAVLFEKGLQQYQSLCEAGYTDKDDLIVRELAEMLVDASAQNWIEAFSLYLSFSDRPFMDLEDQKEKIEALSKMMVMISPKEQLIGEMVQAPPKVLGATLYRNSIQELFQSLAAFGKKHGSTA